MSAPYSQSPSGSCEVSQPPWMMSANVCVRVVEIEVQADGRSRRHDAIAIEPDELPLRKELEVLPIVRGLEPLLVGERRKHHALQRLELLGMLGLCRRDDQTVRQLTSIGSHDLFPRGQSISAMRSPARIAPSTSTAA